MSRLRSLAVIFLLVAAAATSGQAAMSFNKPAPAQATTPPVVQVSAERAAAIYINDIAGKRVRLVGPHFMPDPAQRDTTDGRPGRIDRR